MNTTTGALIPVAGSPFAASPSPSVIYTDPTSFFNKANTEGSGNISGFIINITTGALTQIAGSLWSTFGTNPYGLAIVSY